MSQSAFKIERLGIAGVGLIGGSLACAARAAGVAETIIGYGRSRSRLEEAMQEGVIDAFATTPMELGEADLIVVCTPVDRIAADVCELLQATPSTTLVTDVGSIKGSIVRDVGTSSAAAHRFLGSHPLAGSHLTGFENSDARLFTDRLCVLTPLPSHTPETIEKLRQFWEAVGMRVIEATPDEHDRILAYTSHLPHLAASAVAALVEKPFLEFASTGYRDTTRVAAGDPELWTAIFTQNTQQLAEITDQLIDMLREFREALTKGQSEKIGAFLKVGQDRRSAYRDRPSDSTNE